MYYGHHHYTCRFVSQHGIVWYYCGIYTGTSLVNEGPLQSVTNLSVQGSQVATAAIYTRDD